MIPMYQSDKAKTPVPLLIPNCYSANSNCYPFRICRVAKNHVLSEGYCHTLKHIVLRKTCKEIQPVSFTEPQVWDSVLLNADRVFTLRNEGLPCHRKQINKNFSRTRKKTQHNVKLYKPSSALWNTNTLLTVIWQVKANLINYPL
jgi:hypothetical protein